MAQAERPDRPPATWQEQEARFAELFAQADMPGWRWRFVCVCGGTAEVDGGPGQGRRLRALAERHLWAEHGELMQEVNSLAEAGVHPAFASLYHQLVMREVYGAGQ